MGIVIYQFGINMFGIIIIIIMKAANASNSNKADSAWHGDSWYMLYIRNH